MTLTLTLTRQPANHLEAQCPARLLPWWADANPMLTNPDPDPRTLTLTVTLNLTLALPPYPNPDPDPIPNPNPTPKLVGRW